MKKNLNWRKKKSRKNKNLLMKCLKIIENFKKNKKNNINKNSIKLIKNINNCFRHFQQIKKMLFLMTKLKNLNLKIISKKIKYLN